jgi:hypothetical protein
VLALGLVFAAAALLVLQPWRTLRRSELLLTTLIPASAFGVCAVAATGWRGANEAATWTFACATYACVRAYCRTPQRRHAVATAVAAAGVLEFAAAWLPWWGNGDPARPMIGTFYWHDQYAAFLLPPALLAASLAMWPRRQTRALGWFAGPLCSIGVLFSTSRSTLGLLLLGWGGLLLLALWLPERRRAVVRLLGLAVVTVVAAVALTGPPFFSHRAAPSAAVAQREQDQAAGGNLAWRAKVWHEAAVVYAAHPVAGVGFHGFGSAASAATPGQPHSAFAHDVWLQSLAEGGTLFGGPVLLGTVLALLGLGRRFRAELASRGDPHAVVAVAAVLLLGAHSAVDFDMSYPALTAMVAVVLALALSRDTTGSAGERRPATRVGVPARLAALALTVLALVAVAPAWHGLLHFNVAVTGGAGVPGASR